MIFDSPTINLYVKINVLIPQLSEEELDKIKNL